MSSRSTRNNFTDSYRVVLETPYGTQYIGPYQTKAAAKGQLTSRTVGWNGAQFKGVTGYIEKSTGWERVE